MHDTNLENYALIVCFVTTVCFAITAGVLVYSLIRIVAPTFTIYTRVFEMHLGNDPFWKESKPRCSNYEKEGCDEGGIRPPEDMLTKRREASYAMALRSEVREGKQSAMHMFIIMVMAVLFFIPHWRIARRARGCALFHPALADSTSCSREDGTLTRESSGGGRPPLCSSWLLGTARRCVWFGVHGDKRLGGEPAGSQAGGQTDGGVQQPANTALEATGHSARL